MPTSSDVKNSKMNWLDARIGWRTIPASTNGGKKRTNQGLRVSKL